MRSIFFVIATFLCYAISAQVPQYAVVRPNGTTYILSSFDDAYAQAADDDIIYLPGTSISGDKTISKRLTLIGAGHYPDSTVYTGKTVFTGNIYLQNKCILEGFELPGYIAITNPNGGGCSFIRIRCSVIFLGGTNDHFIDGSVVNTLHAQEFNTGICNSSNILVKNSILQNIGRIQYSSFNNCLFLGHNNFPIYFTTANTVFTNCIFRGIFGFDWVFQSVCFPLINNSSNNCVWFTNNGAAAPGQNNYLDNDPDGIMANSGLTGSIFDYSYNYHLKPNSPYLTAGDDGTQIGIYGGSSPYKEGAVPSNPHIYYKKIDTQTGPDGKLKVEVKVRTNN